MSKESADRQVVGAWRQGTDGPSCLNAQRYVRMMKEQMDVEFHCGGRDVYVV